MHIPDGFIDIPNSAAFGTLALAGTAIALKKAKTEVDDRTAPMAGLTAVFIFAVQMLNFPVAAGTSGHLLGGALAMVLVGPYAASLAITVVLGVQALLFADGGLTALGLNVFNLSVDVAVSDDDIKEQIEALRIRFGTLTTVEKDVEKGDFVTIDLSAKVDGVEIEGGSANGISYEVGSNRMVDGLDEALIGMKLEQVKKFTTQLVGMDEGQSGEVEVTLKSVKKRELPELNDEFAKLASEFETLSELEGDVSQRLTRLKTMEQGAQGRDKLLKLLLETVEIAVPENLVKEEVDAHLEKENRLEDSEHRSEVSLEITNSLKADFLLDTIVKAEAVQVSEAELTEYLIRSAARYQMSPDQFAQEISQAGQIHALMAEVARSKALAVVLERVAIKDGSGRKVDLAALAAKQESGSEQ